MPYKSVAVQIIGEWYEALSGMVKGQNPMASIMLGTMHASIEQVFRDLDGSPDHQRVIEDHILKAAERVQEARRAEAEVN